MGLPKVDLGSHLDLTLLQDVSEEDMKMQGQYCGSSRGFVYDGLIMVRKIYILDLNKFRYMLSSVGITSVKRMRIEKYTFKV